MFDNSDAGIIDPGVPEHYADGRIITMSEGVVHTTLYVTRGEDRVAVVRFHMPESAWTRGTRMAFRRVCDACTSRALQTIVVTLMGG